MRHLSRYILREHIGPFFFAFFVITLIFILNIIFRDLGRILSKGLKINIILEFLFLNLAWIIALAAPMAVLVATLMAFGRLSADNEITAIKASGISLYRLLVPVLLLSAALAGFLIWFNNAVLPEFNHRARLLGSDIARKRPTLNLEPGVLYKDIPQYRLLVRKLKESEGFSYVEDVIIDDTTDPLVRKTILAQRGEIRLNEHTGILTLALYDGEIHQIDESNLAEYRRLIFPKHVVSIAVPEMILQRSSSEYRGDREKSAAMMLAEVRSNKVAIRERRKRIQEIMRWALARYFPPSSRHAEASPPRDNRTDEQPSPPPSIPKERIQRALGEQRQLYRQIQGELEIIESYQRSNNSLMVEVHKKYSIPTACLVFVLIGAPLGILARRGSIAVGGGISLSFFILYWAFLIGGEELADRQFISAFVAMWLPNLLVGAAGVYLVLLTVREQTFLRWERLKLLRVKFRTTVKRAHVPA